MIGTRDPYNIVVAITIINKDVTSTFLFGNQSSSFKTKPNAIAPLIIPAIQRKNASENINCHLCQNIMLKAYSSPRTAMNQQQAATKISSTTNFMHHSKSL